MSGVNMKKSFYVHEYAMLWKSNLYEHHVESTYNSWTPDWYFVMTGANRSMAADADIY